MMPMMKPQPKDAAPVLSPEAAMMAQFQAMQNKSEVAEVLKELFDHNKIYMIGDLSKDEIKIAIRIYMIAEMKNIPIWKIGLAQYMTMMISKNRQGRREILDAIRGYSQPQGFLGKVNPMNWGRQP